jgi:hypothetical protein
MQFDEVLRTWIAWFETNGVAYALAGGNALRAWGHTRPTYDVDFVVNGDDRRRVIAFAESLGYETAHESAGYSNHYHPDEVFGHVDLIYVYGATAEQIFREMVHRSLVGLDLPVVRPEHLIAMKVHAMKSSAARVLIDAPDIAFLLTLPGLDRERVREYFSQHGLLKIYDDLEKERH